MAINSPEQLLATITLEGVDMDLLERQTQDFITHLRECQTMAPTHRRSMLGLKSLLLNMVDCEDTEDSDAEPVPLRSDPSLVNRARDLYVWGKSITAIAHQLNTPRQGLGKMFRGGSFVDLPYEPTEFAEQSDPEGWQDKVMEAFPFLTDPKGEKK